MHEPSDGIAEEVERQLQLALAAAAVAARHAIAARQHQIEQAQRDSEQAARQVKDQIDAERVLATARLRPVFDPGWWETADAARRRRHVAGGQQLARSRSGRDPADDLRSRRRPDPPGGPRSLGPRPDPDLDPRRRPGARARAPGDDRRTRPRPTSQQTSKRSSATRLCHVASMIRNGESSSARGSWPPACPSRRSRRARSPTSDKPARPPRPRTLPRPPRPDRGPQSDVAPAAIYAASADLPAAARNHGLARDGESPGLRARHDSGRGTCPRWPASRHLAASLRIAAAMLAKRGRGGAGLTWAGREPRTSQADRVVRTLGDDAHVRRRWAGRRGPTEQDDECDHGDDCRDGARDRSGDRCDLGGAGEPRPTRRRRCGMKVNGDHDAPQRRTRTIRFAWSYARGGLSDSRSGPPRV